MNDKLLTHDGGQPFLASDFTFMQNALLASIGHLSRANGERYILWGVLSEDKQSIVEGAVVIDGNVYQVPALGAINSQYLCFREREYDEREFENGTKQNVKLAVDAYLSTSAAGAIAYVRAEELLTPQELSRKALFEVKEITGDVDSDTSMFNIDLEQPLNLKEGDVIIATMRALAKGTSNQYIVTTSYGAVVDLDGFPYATLHWISEGYAQTYNITNEYISYAYSSLNAPSIKLEGQVTISLIIIKSGL